MEKPTFCNKIIYEKGLCEWASVQFSSKSQIADLIASLEKLRSGEIDHAHLQFLDNNEKCASEIAFHFPPAKPDLWPHYFNRD